MPIAHAKELPLHTWKLATTNYPSPYYGFPFQQTQTHLTPSNYHSAAAAAATGESQQCKRKRSNEAGNWVSSRWNPTPEQLQCLEQLYCSGTRTPTAKQIQQIAAKLRRFGKIEGKNVFYWFQNHKSRERQKQHRKMNLGLSDPRKQPGLIRGSGDLRQAKHWASLSNSCTSSEESVSIQRAVIAACSADKGVIFEERQRELQQSGPLQKIEMPPPTTAPETLFKSRGQMLVKTQIFEKLLALENNNLYLEFTEDELRRESQTLQLFPLSNQVLQAPNIAESSVSALTKNPIQFYEFFL